MKKDKRLGILYSTKNSNRISRTLTTVLLATSLITHIANTSEVSAASIQSQTTYVSTAKQASQLNDASQKTNVIRKVSLKDLEQMAKEARDALWQQAKKENHDVKLYLHWSAKHYGQFYNAYHINIDHDGSIYVTTNDLSELKGHTYMRNTGSIGIALACCEGAKPDDLGKEPPTEQQIDMMAQVVATLSQVLHVPIDKMHVMTHGEAGDNEDYFFPSYENNGRPYGMYGPLHTRERWDLAILKNGDIWRSGGDILRLKSRRYLK